LDFEAECRDLGEKPPQFLDRQRRSADRPQVSLDADGVDRGSGGAHPPQQGDERRAPRILLRCVELNVVLVDDEARVGVGLTGGAIGEVEIFWTEHLKKYRLA